MKSRLSSIVAIAASAVALVITIPTSIAGQTSGTPERFTAFAVNPGNFGPPQSGTVEIVVTRWSTEDEREKLIAVLLDRGPYVLLNELRETRRVGYFRTPSSIGYDLHFAQSAPEEDGGRRVILMTDRPVGFWESANQPRSIEYPFTLIELLLNREGEGEGKMWIATRIAGNRRLKLIEV